MPSESMLGTMREKLGPRIRQSPARGFSLLEMVFATALMAGTLVPALAVMRDSMAKSREMNHRNVLSISANYYMELFSAYVAQYSSFLSNYSVTTAFPSPDGYQNIRLSISISDNPANGGITNQLYHLQVTAFDDLNQSGALDVNEPSVKYRTKIAKLQSYENLPN